MTDTRALQARLAALGYSPGPIDGVRGRRTNSARDDAFEDLGKRTEVELFHSSGLHRIHWHWTAGAAGVIDLERRHYHFIVDAEARVIEGLHAPEANATPRSGAYAAHTLDANSGAIGLSIDAMADAQERPFSWGSEPMTWPQVHALAKKTAELCERYWIPVSRYSTLSHSEVQPTLGIPQRWKWDINVLPGMDAPGDPIEIGDRIRGLVRRFKAGEHAECAAPAASAPAEISAELREKADRYDEIVTIVNR